MSKREISSLAAVPFSGLATPEAERAWQETIFRDLELQESWSASDKGLNSASGGLEAADFHPASGDFLDANREAFLRKWEKENIFPPLFERMCQRFAVAIEESEIAGVPVEVFTPIDGVAANKRHILLLNLHGGGFITGSRTNSRLESIPICSLASVKVISIDYRHGIAHPHPAAIEDAAAVYESLLKTHRANNIGVFGCSAGGLLTAQLVFQLCSNEIAMPGAIGMLFGTGEYWMSGDSAYIAAGFAGKQMSETETSPRSNAYLAGSDPSSPEVFPMRHPEVLASFPPSLLISGSRSLDLSSVCDAHNKLRKNGVDSHLHIWDGMGHVFSYDSSIPESQEAYQIIADFFTERLLPPWYASEMHNFAAADMLAPPPAGGALFIGSSSFRLWSSLRSDMAPIPVIQRGFGGATIADINANFHRIVTPYQPDVIVFYGGENDLASALKPEEVAADFNQFVDLAARYKPGTPILVLSVKASPACSEQVRNQERLNCLLAARAKSDTTIKYVDVRTPLFDGSRLKDVYLDDGCHLKPEGYSIWAPIIRRELEAAVPTLTTGRRKH